jgi:hypothetical protein
VSLVGLERRGFADFRRACHAKVESVESLKL